MNKDKERSLKNYREVPGHDNYYVTACGQVYSKRKKTRDYPLKMHLDKDGYPRVVLYNKGKRWDATIHILQALCWIGEIPEGYESNHKDGDKMNMHYTNFELITKKANHLHSINVLELYKLTFIKATDIRRLHKNGKSIRFLATKYDVHYNTINRIINNQLWKPSYHLTK